MDDEFASHSPFGRRVVHGLLTAAVVSRVHTELTGPGFAYAGQELRFLTPLFIGDRITVEVTIIGKKRKQAHPDHGHHGSQANRRSRPERLSAYKHLRFR